MARRASSSRWLQRQRADRYVKRRREEGYRSRAAYKLQEINRRDRLIHAGSCVVDLGASPGGWTQVAVAVAGGRGTVVAVDVQQMEAIEGAAVITGDCRDVSVMERVREALGGRAADLVMSDMSPNITGVAAVDDAAGLELARVALDFARSNLKPGGALLVKLFQSGETDDFVTELESCFRELTRRKPDASRSRSREIYIVAKGFGPGLGADFGI